MERRGELGGVLSIFGGGMERERSLEYLRREGRGEGMDMRGYIIDEVG